jgi:hypothetical protein
LVMGAVLHFGKTGHSHFGMSHSHGSHGHSHGSHGHSHESHGHSHHGHSHGHQNGSIKSNGSAASHDAEEGVSP